MFKKIKELPCEAYKGEKPFAFISYSHSDSTEVYEEIKRLYRMRCRLWYDEGIPPSSEWPEQIANAIQKAEIFIVFITQKSIQRKNVRDEIYYALKLEKPIFAVHLQKTTLPPGLDLKMSHIQAILKWEMSKADYLSKLRNTLPDTIIKTAHDELSYDVTNTIIKMKTYLENKDIDLLAQIISNNFFHQEIGGKTEVIDLLKTAKHLGHMNKWKKVSLDDMEITLINDMTVTVYPLDLHTTWRTISFELVLREHEEGWLIVDINPDVFFENSSFR